MSHGRSVSSHLNSALEEYDYRIRTFVPYYEEMLDEAERLVGIFASPRPTVLDLGIGSGAFSERCLKHRPEARLIGGTISLHHVPEPEAKKALFQRWRRDLFAVLVCS